MFELLLALQRERRVAAVIVTHNVALARKCRRALRLRLGALEAVEERALAAPPDGNS